MTIEHSEDTNFLIVKHVNNKIEIQSKAVDGSPANASKSPQTLVVMTLSSNIERDIFVMIYRQFKEAFLSQPAEQPIESSSEQLN